MKKTKALQRFLALLLTLSIMLGLLPLGAVAAPSPAQQATQGQQASQPAQGSFIAKGLSDEVAAKEIERLLGETQFVLNTDELEDALAGASVELEADTGMSLVPQDPEDTLTVDGDAVVNIPEGGSHTVTVNRPKGATAGYTVSVDWQFYAPGQNFSSDDSALITDTLVFAPGDETKTLTVPLPVIETYDPWNGSRPFFLRFFNCDRTSIDKSLLQFNLAATSDFSSKTPETHEGQVRISFDQYYNGETVPILVQYNNPVHVTESSTLTLQGLNGGSPVTLTPANAGATDTYVFYLLTLTDAYFHHSSDGLYAKITSAAPVTDIYNNVTTIAPGGEGGELDLLDGGYFKLAVRPVFGAVTPSKDEYQNGETVTVTTALLNGALLEYKGMVQEGEDGFPPAEFMLSLDGGASYVSSDTLSYSNTTKLITATFEAPLNADMEPDTHHPEAFHLLGGSTFIASFGSQSSFTVAGSSGQFEPVTSITVTGLESGLTMVPSGQDGQRDITVDIAPASASIQGYAWNSSNPGVAVVRGGKLMPELPGETILTLTSNEVAYRQKNGLGEAEYTGLVQQFTVKVYRADTLPTLRFMEPALYIDYEKINSYFGPELPPYGKVRWATRFVSDVTGAATETLYNIRLLDLRDPAAPEQIWRDWFTGYTKSGSYAFPAGQNQHKESWKANYEWNYSETDPATGELLPAYRIVVDNSSSPSGLGGPVEISADVYIRPPHIGAACTGPAYYEAGTTVTREVGFGGLRTSGGTPSVTVAVYKDDVALPAHNYGYADCDGDSKIKIELPNAEAGNYRIEWSANNADDAERKAEGSSTFRVIDTNLNYIYIEDSTGNDALTDGQSYVIKADFVKTSSSEEILKRYADLEPVRRVTSSVMHSQASYTLTAPDGASTWMGTHGYGGWMDNWMSVPADGQTYVLTCTENTFKRSISADLTAESLENKLYLFDMRSSGLPDDTTYTLEYTNGDNVEKSPSVKAYNHQVAIYEPSGIISDVTVTKVHGEEYFTGFVAHAALLSGESVAEVRMGSKNAAYPINAVPMRSADRIVLTLNDANGSPLKNKEVQVRITRVNDDFTQTTGLETRTTTLTTSAQGLIPAPLPEGALQSKRGLGGEWMFCVEISASGFKPRVEFLRLQVMRSSITLRQAGHKIPGPDNTLVEGHIEDILLADDGGFSKIKLGANDVYTYAASAKPQLYLVADANYGGTTFHHGTGIHYSTSVKSLSYAPGYYLYTFPYGLKDVMAADSLPQTFYFNAAGRSSRIATLSATLSAEEKLRVEEARMAETLGDGLSMDPKVSDLTKLEGTNFSDQLKGAFHNLDFELPLSPLPISFSVSKRDNVFEVTGLVSIQIPPINSGLTAAQEAGLEYASAGSALLQEITNNVLNQSTGTKEWTVQMSEAQSATFFSGIRGYITAIATYDRDSGQVNLQLTDGGFIMEASINSGEVWYPTAIPFVRVGISAGASLKNITSFSAANVSRIPKSDLVSGRPLLDIGFGTIIEINLTVMGGLSASVGSLQGFLGIVGKGTAGIHMQTIYRHYLRDNYPQTANTRFRHQGGMRMYLDGALSLDGWVGIGGKRIGFTLPLWDGSANHYSPDSYINPLHPSKGVPPFAAGARISLYEAPVAAEYMGVLEADELANGLDAMASPKTNDDGSILAYVKNGQLFYRASGSESRVDTQQEDIAGWLDMAGTSGLSVLAWEAYKSSPDIERVNQQDQDELTAFFSNAFAPSEMYVGVSTGGTFDVKKLSDNSIADMQPQTAVNADSAIVLWQQGTMTNTVAQEGAEATSGFEGRMVFSRYSGGDWSKQISLLATGEETQVLSYDVALAPDGTALVALELERGNGSEIVCAHIDAQNKIRLIENGLQGTTPQVAAVTAGGQQRFLLGYHPKAPADGGSDESTTIDFSFMALTTDGKTDPDIDFSTELPRSAIGFSFLKGTDKTLDAMGIAWLTSDMAVGSDGASPSSTLSMSHFAQSGSGYMLAGVTPLSTHSGYASSFDAYLHNGEVVTATLCTDAGGENGVIQSETIPVANEIIVGGPLYNDELAAPKATLPISFKVTNAGYSDITQLSFKLDGEPVVFGALSLQPLATESFTLDHFTLPQTAGETDILVQASFRDGITAEYTAKASIASPDVSVTLLSVEDDGTGVKSAVVSITNQSPFELSTALPISVGLYTDALGTNPVANTPALTLTAADIANINEGGTATASFALPASADYFVAATAKNDANPANNTAFIQGDKIPVTGVTLNPTSLVLARPGATGTLTATVQPKDASNQNVAWMSKDTTVATVDAAGTVTAIRKGRTEIVVTTADGGKTATCTVTVNDDGAGPGPMDVPVTGIVLAPSVAELATGESLQLEATVRPANASNKTVNWQSDNPAIATVDANGKVTAVRVGTANIVVTTVDGGKTATCALTVKAATVPQPEPPTITSVKLAQSSLRLAKGQKATVGAVVYYSDNTSSSEGLTWTSDNEKVAKVDPATGKITAAKNLKKNGKATITATAENGKSATVKVTVLKKSAKAVKVTKVTVSGAKKTLDVGKTARLKVKKVSPSNATAAAISWKSNKPAVLHVDATGKLTALKPGKAKLTVKAGTKSTSFTVEVTAPVQEIVLNKKSLNLKKGKSALLTPTVTYNIEGYTAKLAWKSSNTKVATVSSKGKITAKGKGKATITVSAPNGKKATCKITVK